MKSVLVSVISLIGVVICLIILCWIGVISFEYVLIGITVVGLGISLGLAINFNVTVKNSQSTEDTEAGDQSDNEAIVAFEIFSASVKSEVLLTNLQDKINQFIKDHPGSAIEWFQSNDEQVTLTAIVEYYK